MPAKLIDIKLNGSDGHDGNHGHYPGGDGANGQSGANAADIDISLSVESGQITVAYNNQPDAQHYELYAPHKLYLKAEGGSGGRGGDGAEGSRGTDGRDATRYSSGTNGGPGGRGGDGGNGGYGGHGGKVTIRVNEEDMDLLALIPGNGIDVRGGEGGKGGTGGPGGPGGQGGASYSWSETITYNGNSTTTYHSNPGGSSGYSGSPGVPGKPGQRGQDGSIQYIVTNAYGDQTTYTGPYLLRIAMFTLNPSPDNINEPGETLKITDVLLRNTGPMPTPKAHSFVFYGVNTDDSGWVTFDNTVENALGVQVPPHAPHEAFNAGGHFPFTIKAHRDVAVDEVFSAKTTVDIIAMLPRIRKIMTTYSTPQELVIQYPTALTPIIGKRAILSNETPPIAFQLCNPSTAAIGHESPSRRPMQVTITSSHHPIFLADKTSAANQIPKSGLIQAPTLDAQCHAMFSGTLALPNVPAYTIITLTVTLALGELNHPSDLQVIQQRTLQIQLAESYTYHPDANITLVTNGQVNARTMTTWQSLVEAGLSMDIWNISLYAGCSYRYRRPQDGKSFMDTLQGKTVVILNNSFTDDNGETRRSTHYLDSAEIFEAARYEDIRTYVIGEGFDLAQTIVPLGSYPDKVFAHSKEIIRDKQRTDTTPPARTHHTLEKTSSHWFGKEPDPKQLAKKADKLSNKLQSHFPGQSHFLFFKVQPHLKIDGRLRQTWIDGTVEVRRGLDTNHARIAHYNADDMKADNMITIYQLFKLMPFQMKLEKISHFLNNHTMLPPLRQAICSDLADEQIALRRTVWNGPLSRNQLTEKLCHLPALCAFNFREVLQQARGKQFLKELFLEYDCLINALPSTRDHLLFGRRGSVLTNLCHADIARWIKTHRRDLGLTSADAKTIKRSIKTQYQQTPPVLVLAQWAKPYETQSVAQDNGLEIARVQKRDALPPVTTSVPTRGKDQFYFQSEALRLQAIEAAERESARGLSRNG